MSAGCGRSRSDDGTVTTVTFEEKGGKTLLMMHERYPSKEALDRAIAGMEGGVPRRSSNWMSFSAPWARAWNGHEVVNLAGDRLLTMNVRYADVNIVDLGYPEDPRVQSHGHPAAGDTQ